MQINTGGIMNLAGFKKIILPAILTLMIYGSLYSQENKKLPAFPTAEGGGKWTAGGRGGNVAIVKSLSGFGAALKSTGPRTIVFQTSGTIVGDFSIPSNTTIAGQTAPGDGICIHGSVVMGSNVILRYLRIRSKQGENADALGAREQKNIIVDHLTASWSTDENLSLYHNVNVTIQWCLVSQAMGGGHGFAGIWGGDMNTQHHNLIAHNTGRNPRFAGGAENNDFRNNVTYNWGKHPCKGGEDKQNGSDRWTFSAINWVANYNKPGPTTPSSNIKFIMPGGGSWYVKDNFMHGKPDLTADNWKGVTGGKKRSEPAPHIPMDHVQTAEEAYESVLKYVGCSFPKRDRIDEIVVNDVKEGKATHGSNGMVTSMGQVGGLPELKSAPAPADGDEDGMPDAWEKAKGLNPADASDRNGIGAGGYTNLEIYLNSLVAHNHYRASTAVAKKVTPKKNDFAFIGNNVFSSSTELSFSIPKKTRVTLEVFDNAGKKVKTIINEVRAAGNHSTVFDGSHLGAGLYVCKLTVSNSSLSKKMFLIK